MRPLPRPRVQSWLSALALLLLATLGMPLSQAQTITVTNQLANGYKTDPFPETCPSGYTVSNIPSGNHIERPHAIYNATSRQWVLWAHYDNSSYTLAEALVATSASQCGPYTIASTFAPEGYQSRDETIFQDTDGSGYFITASNHYGGANDTIAVFKMTADYLGVDSSAGVTWLFDNGYREAPVVAKSGSVYYLFTSQASGWFPSQAAYATSTAMMSGWSALSNMGNPATFGGQENDIKIFKGSAGTAFILTFDHLGGNLTRDDGALWLPVILDSVRRTATLNWYSSYQVNTATGALTLPVHANLAPAGTATASSVASGSSAKNAADGSYATEWSASSVSWPSWWMVDLGSTKPIGAVNISWYMVKGSEAYYQYKIDTSTDGVNFATLDRTANKFYGFTTDQLNVSARYVKIELVNAVLQNNPNNWYTPQMWEVQVLAP